MGSRARQLPMPGAILAGRLRIERRIGEGALSVVFEATDLPLNRRVAVKLLTPEHAQDEEQRERFIREARAAASISNEHVLRLIDVQSLDDGTPFLVLEYLEGLALDEILEREGPPAIDVAVDWVLQALDGVAEVHARGLVHRDIKPGNLFLAERPNRPSIVKVLDFGTVKDLARRTKLTQTGASLGSPAYMSPEQIRGEDKIDARTDVWSFGVTLFELVTGDLPWRAGSIPTTLAAILREDPEPIRRLRSDVPDALEALIMRCLSRDRDQRFANAGELHVALSAVRATMPKTTRATKTIRLSPGAFPAGGKLFPNDDVSAVRPRIVLVPPRVEKRGPRARIFLVAVLSGFALAAFAVGLALTLHTPKTTVVAPSSATGQKANETLPPNLQLPSSPVTGVASASVSPPRPVASTNILRTTSIAFETMNGVVSPPVSSLGKIAGADMLKCANDARCTPYGGRNLNIDQHSKVLGASPIIVFDTTIKTSHADFGTCVVAVEPCIGEVLTKHKIHAQCPTNDGSCRATLAIKFQ